MAKRDSPKSLDTAFSASCLLFGCSPVRWGTMVKDFTAVQETGQYAMVWVEMETWQAKQVDQD